MRRWQARGAEVAEAAVLTLGRGNTTFDLSSRRVVARAEVPGDLAAAAERLAVAGVPLPPAGRAFPVHSGSLALAADAAERSA